MTAIDFPSSPEIGDVIIRGEYSWRWTGVAWKKVTGSSQLTEATSEKDLLSWDAASGAWVPGSQDAVIGEYTAQKIKEKVTFANNLMLMGV
jgi:hypothetical protein